MSYIKRFIDFILFSNIYIALGAFLLTVSTILEQHLTLPKNYPVLVFFSTLLIYNLQRIFYKTPFKSEAISVRRIWILEHQKTIKALAIIGLFGTAISVFYFDIRTILYLSPLFLLSIGYFFPSVQLRKFALLKTFILVTVWTATCYILPILLSSPNFTSINLTYALSGFCFMAAICLPFDSRDIEIDKKENIQTFAVLFGSRRVNLIAIIFAIFYLFLIIMSGANSIQFTINLIVFLTCFVFILKNNNPRNEYFYIAGIDGILILKGILCCFLI